MKKYLCGILYCLGMSVLLGIWWVGMIYLLTLVWGR